jgi:hypothetical protein
LLFRKALIAEVSNSSYDRLVSTCPRQLIIKVINRTCNKIVFFVMAKLLLIT